MKFPLAFLDLVQCPSLRNDRCRMVETVQKKTVESPQLVLLLDKVFDVPVLATSWGCSRFRSCRFIDWCVSSSWP